jgi:hypothetical protein
MPHSTHTKRLTPRRTRLLTATALVSLAPAFAGCGSSSAPTVAHLASAKGTPSASPEGTSPAPESTTSHQQEEVDYAKCLRSHGAGDVPEPSNRLRIVNGLGGGPNPGPPQVKAAQKQCNNLLPSGGGPSPQMREQAVERALKFAECMRSHGEPSFPDPNGGGGGSGHVRIGGPGPDIDLDSPRFKAAGKACQEYFGPAGSNGPP